MHSCMWMSSFSGGGALSRLLRTVRGGPTSAGLPDFRSGWILVDNFCDRPYWLMLDNWICALLWNSSLRLGCLDADAFRALAPAVASVRSFWPMIRLTLSSGLMAWNMQNAERRWTDVSFLRNFLQRKCRAIGLELSQPSFASNGCSVCCVGAYVLIGLYIFNVSTLTVFCRSGGTLIMLSALKWWSSLEIVLACHHSGHCRLWWIFGYLCTYLVGTDSGIKQIGRKCVIALVWMASSMCCVCVWLEYCVWDKC